MKDRLARYAGPAVVLAAACAYVTTAMRTVQAGDSGELAAMGAHGGVAHPPGYPLYILWLRLFSWLPTVPTHRAALATAFLGALTIGMLQAACRAWGARRSVAVGASAVFAVSPLAWKLSTEPEVFTHNVLLALSIVLVSAPRVLSSHHEAWRVAMLGILAGLGISSHHSIVLLAPLGLYTAVVAVRRAHAPLRAALAAIGCLALGLSPYAYLFIAARSTPLDSPCQWGDTTTWAGFVHHFLRRDYGTFQLHATSQYFDPLAQIAYLARTLLTDGLAFSLLAPAGAVAALLRSGRRAVDGKILALTGAFLLTGPLFALRLTLPPTGVSGLVVERFHLLPLALATVLGALGFESLLRSRSGSRMVEASAIAVLSAIVVARTAWSVPAVRAHRTPTTERFLRNVFGFVPPRSVLLVSSDDLVGGFLYMQCALHARPDVEVITPRLLLADWYWPRVSARLGFVVEHGVRKAPSDDPTLDGAALLAQLIGTGRPVLLDGWYASGLETRVPSHPIGPLIRVSGSWTDVPPPDALFVANDELFRVMDMDRPPPAPQTWAGVRYASYARPWRVLAAAFERAGDAAKAEKCRARASAFEP